MPIRNPTKTHEPPSDAWMISFADLLSLILTFFVLLYSMSIMEEKRWADIKASLTRQLNPSKEPNRIKRSANFSISTVEENAALDLDYLYSILLEKTDNETILNTIKLQRNRDHLTISLPSNVLFEPGNAKLKEESYVMMEAMADILHIIGNRIDINGHSDPSPINSDTYPSNWELSLSRSLAVTNKLYNAGYPYHIKTFGMADSRYKPPASANPDIDKKSLYHKARRVDIIIRDIQAETLGATH